MANQQAHAAGSRTFMLLRSSASNSHKSGLRRHTHGSVWQLDALQWIQAYALQRRATMRSLPCGRCPPMLVQICSGPQPQLTGTHLAKPVPYFATTPCVLNSLLNWDVLHCPEGQVLASCLGTVLSVNAICTKGLARLHGANSVARPLRLGKAS